MPPEHLARVSPVCRFGLIALGFAFLIAGGFFVLAAVRDDSSEAKGLEALLDQPYGRWLLGLVAVGLAAFGAYSWIEALWRRVSPPRRSRLGQPGRRRARCEAADSNAAAGAWSCGLKPLRQT